ncbi:MAG: DUF5723 family protein [Bacteroidales bacterium]
MSIILLCLFSQSSAQTNRTGYFMDKYSHRHIYNPALSPTWGYISIPVVGLFSIGTESNLSLSKFLFPLENSKQLGTFMHPDISSDQFLSGLHQQNYFSLDNTIDILSFGFYTGQSSFWTFDLSLKTNFQFNIPYEFFNFVKNGMSSSQTNYQIKDMEFGFNSYVDLSLGYAQDIGDEWRVGGKLKFLVGAVDASLNIDKMNLTLSEDKWAVQTLASAQVLAKGANFVTDSTGAITGFDLRNPGVAGVGVGIDLGAEYRFQETSSLRNFRISLAVTDLGFVRYRGANIKTAQAEGAINFEGFNNISINDSMQITGIKDQVESLKNDLYDMLDLREVIANKGITRFLHANLNAGIEYSFLKDKLSAGLLSTTRFGLPKVTTELTASFNARPLNWLAISLSYSFLNKQWSSIGWGLNITPKWGLNLFVGSDYTFFKVTPQFVPINTATFNFFVGLNVPLGNNRSKNRMPLREEITPQSK